MATIGDKSEASLAPFTAPVAVVNNGKRPLDGTANDSVVVLTRGRNERKSIVAERRITKHENGVNGLGNRPQKSQSAGDLPSYRVRYVEVRLACALGWLGWACIGEALVLASLNAQDDQRGTGGKLSIRHKGESQKTTLCMGYVQLGGASCFLSLFDGPGKPSS